MKRFQSVLFAAVLTVAIGPTGFAGNISTTAPGNISTTAPGNISTTALGNISTTAPGDITGLLTWGDITGVLGIIFGRIR